MYEDFKKYVIPSKLLMSILISVILLCIASIVACVICLTNYNSMCITIYCIGILSIGILICISVMFIRSICCDALHHIEPTPSPNPKSKSKSKSKSKKPDHETVIAIDNPMV